MSPTPRPETATAAGATFGFGEVRYAFAYQPIVDIQERAVHSYEALVRGPRGEPAGTVFAQVPPEALHDFDRKSRVSALELAVALGIDCRINLNFQPRSLSSSPAAVLSTLEAAARLGLPADRIVIEVTESEFIDDLASFGRALDAYRPYGIQLAIDDFGAGYAGLSMLADFVPDLIKLDMALVRGIESHGSRQAIVRAILQVCLDLGIDVIAEGVETPAEHRWFAAVGVHLFQGYLYARPGFRELVEPVIP